VRGRGAGARGSPGAQHTVAAVGRCVVRGRRAAALSACPRPWRARTGCDPASARDRWKILPHAGALSATRGAGACGARSHGERRSWSGLTQGRAAGLGGVPLGRGHGLQLEWRRPERTTTSGAKMARCTTGTTFSNSSGIIRRTTCCPKVARWARVPCAPVPRPVCDPDDGRARAGAPADGAPRAALVCGVALCRSS